MKKSDLKKLLESVADDGDVNEAILKADEFKGLKDLSKLTANDIKVMADTNEVYKAFVQSQIDSAVSKGVETYKNGKGAEAIKRAVEEAKNGKKSPEQEALEKLKKQFDEAQAELTKERNTAKYSKLLKDKGLPVELVDFIYGDGAEETVNKNIDSIGKIINSAVDSKVNAKLGSSAYVPPTGEQSIDALGAQIAAAVGVK